MDETPRTERVIDGIVARGQLRGFGMPEDVKDLSEHARQLERELAESQKAYTAAHSELEAAERLVYVPGVLKCAKCNCVVISTLLDAANGRVAANNDPQQCPNGCGPMWRRTERDAGNELCDRLDKEYERAERAVADLAACREVADGLRKDAERLDAERMRMADALREIIDSYSAADNMQANYMKLIAVRAFTKPLDAAIDAAIKEQAMGDHTDHPARHWDRTCPACNAAALTESADEQGRPLTYWGGKADEQALKWDEVSVRVDKWKRLQALCEELEPHEHYDGMNECNICDEPLTDTLIRHCETLLAVRAEQGKREPVESMLYLGGTYETQGGELVKMVGIENIGTPYETLVDEAGVNRYSRRVSDAGRCTGSAHDYSDPKNIKRPFAAKALNQINIYATPTPDALLAAELRGMEKAAEVCEAWPYTNIPPSFDKEMEHDQCAAAIRAEAERLRKGG